MITPKARTFHRPAPEKHKEIEQNPIKTTQAIHERSLAIQVFCSGINTMLNIFAYNSHQLF